MHTYLYDLKVYIYKLLISFINTCIPFPFAKSFSGFHREELVEWSRGMIFPYLGRGPWAFTKKAMGFSENKRYPATPTIVAIALTRYDTLRYISLVEMAILGTYTYIYIHTHAFFGQTTRAMDIPSWWVSTPNAQRVEIFTSTRKKDYWTEPTQDDLSSQNGEIPVDFGLRSGYIHPNI
jgi:hypothetical protein